VPADVAQLVVHVGHDEVGVGVAPAPALEADDFQAGLASSFAMIVR